MAFGSGLHWMHGTALAWVFDVKSARMAARRRVKRKVVCIIAGEWVVWYIYGRIDAEDAEDAEETDGETDGGVCWLFIYPSLL